MKWVGAKGEKHLKSVIKKKTNYITTTNGWSYQPPKGQTNCGTDYPLLRDRLSRVCNLDCELLPEFNVQGR